MHFIEGDGTGVLRVIRASVQRDREAEPQHDREDVARALEAVAQ